MVKTTKWFLVLLLIISACSNTENLSDEDIATRQRAKQALLAPYNSSEYRDPSDRSILYYKQAEDIAALGPVILPVVYDALLLKGDFAKQEKDQYRFPERALSILAMIKDHKSVKKVKKYYEKSPYWKKHKKQKALATILEIQNTAENREYVVLQLTEIISQEGINGPGGKAKNLIRLLVETNIPINDKLSLFKNIPIRARRQLSGIIEILSYNPTPASVEVLKEYINDADIREKPHIAQKIYICRMTMKKYVKDILVKQSEKNIGEKLKKNLSLRQEQLEKDIKMLGDNFNIVQIYEESVNAGYPAFVNQLGLHYLHGDIVKQDLIKAAMYLGGGSRHTKTKKEALKWLRKAAREGNEIEQVLNKYEEERKQ